MVLMLRDSLNTLSTEKPVKEITSPTYYEYVILPNDSPWGIVHKFYGNRVNWQETARRIAEDNGIWDESAGAWKPIHPGDVLKLYNIK
jgi:nucleoid-associated protein YgaU